MMNHFNIVFENKYIISTHGTCEDNSSYSLNSISVINLISQFPSISKMNTKKASETIIEVYDMVGSLVYKTTSTGVVCNIDLSEKNKGIYLYKIINLGKEIQRGKLLKD